LSYDARTIVLVAPDGTPQLLDLPAGTPRPLPGVDANDTVIAWSSDGRSVFVQKESDTVGRLERVDLATGRRRHANSCLVTMVAVDARGLPSPVPGLILETPEDRKRHAAALERRQGRGP